MITELLKNLHKGKRCFILGNGPSLTQLDLSLLKKEITFGCNHIYLMKDFKPTYWCIADYWVMEQIKDDVRIVYKDVPKFTVRTHRDKVLSAIPNTYFLEALTHDYDKNGEPKFSLDLTKGIYGGYSIVYVMIQIAYYLGCNPIYIIGIDGIKKGKMDSFFPGAVPANNFENQTDLSHIAFKFARKTLAGRSVDGERVKIYNATPDTAVKSFKEVNYEDLFK